MNTATMPFNIEGLAERWQVAPGTIYNMIRRGDLKAFRAGKSSLRISAQEVMRHEAGECGGLSYTGMSGAPSDEKTGRQSAFPYRPKTAMRLNGS